MSNTRYPKLPEDVMIEILSRLPVKSLLRFNCVCKDWSTLIEKPSFIGKHLHQENNDARLLVQHYNSNTMKYYVTLFPDETLAGMPPVHEDLGHLFIPFKIGKFIGPIHGLFLLHTDWNGFSNRVALWNPALRQFRLLPKCHPSLQPDFSRVWHTIGFGLDPLTNHYKVIWIRFFWYEIRGYPYRYRDYGLPFDYCVVALYTLGSDSWRYLDPLKPSNSTIYNSLGATYLNGTYYWLSSGIDDEHCLLSFDMSFETFREIPGPDHPKQTEGSLTLYNDFIALFLCKKGSSLQSVIDIWVMEEEGCWTKLLIIKPFPEGSRPLGFWKSDQILLENSTSQLVLYNHNNHEITDLGIRGHHSAIGIRVFGYKESLVSLKWQH